MGTPMHIHKAVNAYQIVGHIHNNLHSEPVGCAFVINNRKYRVTLAKNGCKQIKYNEDLTFMEQNKAKHSRYAEKAKKGHRITWGIHRLPVANGQWIHVEDNKIMNPDVVNELIKDPFK